MIRRSNNAERNKFSSHLCLCSQRVVLLIALLEVFGTHRTSVCAADDSNINLPLVMERLNEWRSSFVNLHIKWELRVLPTDTESSLSEWAPATDWANARMFDRLEWIWADHGMRLLESQSFLDPEGGSRRTFGRLQR